MENGKGLFRVRTDHDVYVDLFGVAKIKLR